MQTKLSAEFRDSRAGRDAERILRSCVHCGFCNATCPTYQILGDELDGPRGRIYLIKQMLEGGEAGRSTQQHLDRCLTCLNCETTCPSGVEYGKLLSIGRALVDERSARPAPERLTRWLLKEGLTSRLFAPLLKAGAAARRVLPGALRKYLPVRAATGGTWPQGGHARKVLLLAGCVQPAMMPNINAATARVLDAAGVQTLIAAGAGCCGALREHLTDHAGGLADARRNVDAWWPLVEAGTVDAIVTNASACGLAVKHYGEALEAESRYAAKAVRIGAMARDLSELLPDLVPVLAGKLGGGCNLRMTLHTPCTLQHGQGLRGTIAVQLRRLGFDVRAATSDDHLCCGSAGTYSVLQPELSRRLRDRKVANLEASKPQIIVSANMACIKHLQSGTNLLVRHWVEVLDEALAASGRGLGA